jgi:hypothetical protein
MGTEVVGACATIASDHSERMTQGATVASNYLSAIMT